MWSNPNSALKTAWTQHVVRRIEEDAAWALASNPMGAAEVAGVLLGRGSSPVEIVDCQPVCLMQEQDHAYALTGPGRYEFEHAIAQFRSGREDQLSVVGFYRSHLGDQLELTQEDLGLIRTCFADQSPVTLLFRVTADQSYGAKLFSGENGRLVSEFHSDGNAVETPRWRALWQSLSATDTPEKSIPAPALTPARAVATPTYVTSKRRSLLKPIALLASAAAVAVLVGYPLFRGSTGTKHAVDPSTSTPIQMQSGTSTEGGLALRAEKRGDELQLDWNRGSPTIATAAEGILTIQEGNTKEKRIILDASLLKSGSVVYRPVLHQVFVRLVIFDKSGARLDEGVTMYPEGRAAVASDAYKESK